VKNLLAVSALDFFVAGRNTGALAGATQIEVVVRCKVEVVEEAS
jgi:hypothetical protein